MADRCRTSFVAWPVQPLVGMSKPFLSDIKELRRRAREHIASGAVTSAYRGDRETVLRVLNEALATELVCVLRYKRHYYMATGLAASAAADEFAEHAADEQKHADQIAERITQLGGEPNFDPQGLTSRSHSEKLSGRSIAATGLTAVASVGFISPSIDRPCRGLPGLPTWSR